MSSCLQNRFVISKSKLIYNKIKRILINDVAENVDTFLKCMSEIMSCGEIAGTTWEETFLFLYERVRYEGKNIIEEAEKYKSMMINNKWENVNFAGADFSEAYIYEDDIRQLKCAGAVLSNINTKEESEEN